MNTLRFYSSLLVLAASIVAPRGAQAEAEKFSKYFNYTKSLSNAPVAFGEITIVTCDLDDAGTDGDVSLVVRGTDGKTNTTHLNLPGDDFVRGNSTTYAFPFPGGKVGNLESFAIKNAGNSLCIDTVLLYANGGLIMSYEASSPLAGDVMYHQVGTGLYPHGDGKGVVWIGGGSSMRFDDDYIDDKQDYPAMTLTDPNTGAVRYFPARTIWWIGYNGLPLTRSARWKQMVANVANEVTVTACKLPTAFLRSDMETLAETHIGDVMDGTPLYWADGYAKVSLKTAGSKPVYHVDGKLKADVEWVANPVIFADFDVTISCGRNADDTKTGLTIAFSKVKVEVEPGGVLGAAFDLFDIDVKFSVNPLKDKFVETGYCPTISTSAAGNMLMSWPDSLVRPKTTWTETSNPLLPSIPKVEWITVLPPPNPMCVKQSSIDWK